MFRLIDQGGDYLLDPWILFWEMFRQQRRADTHKQSFRKDHFVMASDAALMRHEMNWLTGGSFPAIIRTALLPISSLCDDSTLLLAGMKLDDSLEVHGWATGKNADASENLQRTAEALRTLAQSVVKNYQGQDRPGGGPQGNTVSALLAEADRLLQNMKLQSDGNDVQLRTSIELDKSRLEAIVSAIVAATGQPADPSTDDGMKALVEDFFHHNWRDITSRETIEPGQPRATPRGRAWWFRGR
jgi:hypothetical protein